MARTAPTREECKALFDRNPKVTYDDICVELGRPGNATEIGRFFKGYRNTIPGRGSTAELWVAIERAAKKKAAA